MTRDYKNVTEAGIKQKKTRAKSKNAAQAEKSLPGWIWLVSGVVIGGFVSFIVYLKLNVPIDGATQDGTVSQKIIADQKPPVLISPKTEAIKTKILEEKKQDGSELEFYNVLTIKEPLFPRNEGEKKDATQEQKPELKKDERQAINETNEKRISKELGHVTYLYTLQVGSFIAFKDADKRKANLAMLGIGSRIHAIKTRNVTRYRVMVGPYDELSRIKKIDAEMKANNIKTLLLREKG